MSLEKTRYWAQLQKERQRSLRQFKKTKPSRIPYKTLFLIILVTAFASAVVAFGVYSYKKYRSESSLVISAHSIGVKKGGDFQAALNRAKPGDTIILEAGATFEGAFKLPNKTGSEFITVRTSADELLPASDTRIVPEKHSAILPKIKSNVKGQPAIIAVDGAHHYRFVGVEFLATIEGLYNIIQLGTTEEKRIEDLPHHIEFDRVYIHGSPVEGQRRGIAANGKFIKITNSYISDIKRKGEESQAIAAWATDGPIEITNNYLEAAAENILFGGAKSYLELTPTDCIVRSNHLNKPLIWREEGWAVKNLFEIKNGKRIRVEYNLMTNNWAHAQDGSAILFTTREDSGKNAVIEDIEFSNNLVRRSTNGINIYGGEGNGGRNLVIRNNIFDEIDGFFMKSTDWDGLVIENNTIIQKYNIASAYGKPIKNFVFRNNIVFENEYGIKGDSMGSGQEVIDKLFTNGTVADNIIIGGKKTRYRENNFFLSSIDEAGLVSAEKGDYRLRKGSPYLKKGYGGKQIGADLDPKVVGGK